MTVSPIRSTGDQDQFVLSFQRLSQARLEQKGTFTRTRAESYGSRKEGFPVIT